MSVACISMVDPVSTFDGAGTTPTELDGDPDGVFAVTLDGPLSALAVQQIAPDGSAVLQWDTSSLTSPLALGVEEDGVFLNAPDGSLNLAPGRHDLLLYLSRRVGPLDRVTDPTYSFRVVGSSPDNTRIVGRNFSY